MESHSTSRVASHSTEESSAPGTLIDLSSSSTSTSFDILFEYEGSKQPLSVKHEDVVMKIENQLGKLGYDITVCTMTVPRQEKETKKQTAVLQRWSTKWGCYVDCTESEMIDGDLVTIRKRVCRSVDGQKSKDAAVLNAMTICDRVGKKPTAATAQALKKLFPSSTSTPVPVQRKRVFDPTADCAFSNEKKKKKAARTRGTMINFVLLHDFEKGLPRKEARKQLMEGNCAKKIEIFRTMSAGEVKTKVLREFTTISTISYLQLNGGVHMAISSQQHLDGNEVITNAKKRNGNIVYITDRTPGNQVNASNDDNSGASDGGNNVQTMASTSTEEAVVISSDDSEADRDVLPSFLRGSNKVQGDRGGMHIMAAEGNRTAAEEDRSTMTVEESENRMVAEDLDNRGPMAVEESRRIRAMQDEEYEEMLRADQDKERTRAAMVAKNEKLVALQQRLQNKYSLGGSGTIKIALKLPGLNKAERYFSLSDSTKDLYEYAFSLTGIEKFKIVKSFPPRCTISPNCTLSESQIESSCVLMMDTGADESVLDFLNEDEDSTPEVSVQECSGDLSTILMEAEKDCKEFIKSLNTKFFPAHDINRSTILKDVIALFSTEDVLYHYPLKIHFIGERAIDTGGVCRDMFDEFWRATYAEHFEGSNLLVPSVNAHTDMAVMHALGRILSHGYIFCSALPTRIVYPTLYACLVGVGAKVPAPILLGSFIDYLTTVEQSVVKMGLGVKASVFPIDLQTQLIGILDRFGSRKAPNPHNLRQLLIEAAEYEFLRKPLAAISSIHAGVPPQELPFWSKYTVAQFYTIFQCLTASPTKVLELIEEPVMLHAGEKRVFQFLQQFIGNISNEDVGHFLRFVTGSSVCPTKKIQITFNRVSGLARRPIAHTCAFTLEISTDYTNYMQFSTEMKAVLSDESSWFMDAL